MARPLLVTSDPVLLDRLLRLAAAAGVEPDVAGHATAAAPLWRDAPLVLLGHDRISDAVGAGLPRRPGLLVVGGSLDDAGVWRQAVGLGAEHVVFLPEAEPWLVTRLADAGRPGRRATVVAVVGARGGAGATSFAVAFALAAAREGRRTMLVDADPYGGGIDMALGVEHVEGPRWDDFVEGGAPIDGDALAAVLPRCGEVTVLSWARGATGPITATTVETLLAAARRGADVVVVDVPRSFDEASRAALGAADVAFLVCPAEVRACAAGQRVAEAVRLLVDDARLVVRGPGKIDPADVVRTVGLPYAGWLDPEPDLADALDNGRPPGHGGRGPLAELCRALLPLACPDRPLDEAPA
jgi:secretion/DNA translocation related CpaE-like protein